MEKTAIHAIAKLKMTERTHSDHLSPSQVDDVNQFSDDFLEGVSAVAEFLGWTPRKVRYARETGALPIRVKQGIGLYAFKSELVNTLKTPDTLQARKA